MIIIDDSDNHCVECGFVKVKKSCMEKSTCDKIAQLRRVDVLGWELLAASQKSHDLLYNLLLLRVVGLRSSVSGYMINIAIKI